MLVPKGYNTQQEHFREVHGTTCLPNPLLLVIDFLSTHHDFTWLVLISRQSSSVPQDPFSHWKSWLARKQTPGNIFCLTFKYQDHGFNISNNILWQQTVDIIIPSDLGLNISISTDVEATEDDVKISSWRRHQQKKKVKVCVAEQALHIIVTTC